MRLNGTLGYTAFSGDDPHCRYIGTDDMQQPMYSCDYSTDNTSRVDAIAAGVRATAAQIALEYQATPFFTLPDNAKIYLSVHGTFWAIENPANGALVFAIPHWIGDVLPGTLSGTDDMQNPIYSGAVQVQGAIYAIREGKASWQSIMPSGAVDRRFTEWNKLPGFVPMQGGTKWLLSISAQPPQEKLFKDAKEGNLWTDGLSQFMTFVAIALSAGAASGYLAGAEAMTVSELAMADIALGGAGGTAGASSLSLNSLATLAASGNMDAWNSMVNAVGEDSAANILGDAAAAGVESGSSSVLDQLTRLKDLVQFPDQKSLIQKAITYAAQSLLTSQRATVAPVRRAVIPYPLDPSGAYAQNGGGGFFSSALENENWQVPALAALFAVIVLKRR